ncbi:MAG TPA: nucleotidyltransferase domain-containing protein [Desulfobacterales bacterium]|nr:nucleotidyltransferase domain-containing protein [Desulfobacterales bacterium]
MVDSILEKRDHIISACSRHRVARLHVFGSALSPDYVPGKSDIDFLVDFVPMEPSDLVEAYFGLLDDLRGIVGGAVDLVMVGAVKNHYIAGEIENTKQLLYAS